MHVQYPQPHLWQKHASAPQTLSMNPFPSVDSVQVLTVSSRVQRQHRMGSWASITPWCQLRDPQIQVTEMS